jgi:hypothetical protein
VLSLVVLQVNADYDYDLTSRDVFTIGDTLGEYVDKRARKTDYQAHPAGELVCRPFGLCEPCPADEVSHPTLRTKKCFLPEISSTVYRLMASERSRSVNHSVIVDYYTVNPRPTPRPPRGKSQPGKHVARLSSRKGKISGSLS